MYFEPRQLQDLRPRAGTEQNRSGTLCLVSLMVEEAGPSREAGVPGGVAAKARVQEPAARSWPSLALARRLHLLKLLRINWVLYIPASHFETRFFSWMPLLRMLVWIVISMHLTACLWYDLVLREGTVDLHLEGMGDRATESSHYLVALRQGVYLVTGKPTESFSDPELMLIGVTGWLGGIFFAFIYGNTTMLLTRMNIHMTKHHKHMALIQRTMNTLGLPVNLQQRIRQYHHFLAVHHNINAYSLLMQGLSVSLFIELKAHLFKQMFSQGPFFTGAPTSFLRNLLQVMVEVTFCPGDVVIRCGDVGEQMYFVVKGRLDVLNSSNAVIGKMCENQYFGEIALLISTPRLVSIRAATYCLLGATGGGGLSAGACRAADNDVSQMSSMRLSVDDFFVQEGVPILRTWNASRPLWNNHPEATLDFTTGSVTDIDCRRTAWPGLAGRSAAEGLRRGGHEEATGGHLGDNTDKPSQHTRRGHEAATGGHREAGFKANSGLEWLYDDPSQLRLVAILVRGFGKGADMFGELNSQVRSGKKEPQFLWTELLQAKHESERLWMEPGRSLSAYAYDAFGRRVVGNFTMQEGAGQGEEDPNDWSEFGWQVVIDVKGDAIRFGQGSRVIQMTRQPSGHRSIGLIGMPAREFKLGDSLAARFLRFVEKENLVATSGDSGECWEVLEDRVRLHRVRPRRELVDPAVSEGVPATPEQMGTTRVAYCKCRDESDTWFENYYQHEWRGECEQTRMPDYWIGHADFNLVSGEAALHLLSVELETLEEDSEIETNWGVAPDPWHDWELQNVDYTGSELTEVEIVLMNKGAVKEAAEEECEHPLCARPQRGNQCARWAKCPQCGGTLETTKYTPEEGVQGKAKRENVKKDKDLEEGQQQQVKMAIKVRNADYQQEEIEPVQRPPRSPAAVRSAPARGCDAGGVRGAEIEELLRNPEDSREEVAQWMLEQKGDSAVTGSQFRELMETISSLSFDSRIKRLSITARKPDNITALVDCLWVGASASGIAVKTERYLQSDFLISVRASAGTPTSALRIWMLPDRPEVRLVELRKDLQRDLLRSLVAGRGRRGGGNVGRRDVLILALAWGQMSPKGGDAVLCIEVVERRKNAASHKITLLLPGPSALSFVAVSGAGGSVALADEHGGSTKRGEPQVSPKLDPMSSGLFFRHDYPHDQRPPTGPEFDFNHPYPLVQDTDMYDKDYVKDENSDGGEWKAQMEYDTMRTKVFKARADAEVSKKALDKIHKE
ncbi:unnamed protein product [Prorocentrum cordatum]|uniref:Cyclic nucleotide-binding domain-containing protein n=1 Tax=Prorocentrum cordatum TaxID=2364126 RepID=A0ABN9VDZ0_9DINO|nr:unnamed protein product [Polarella glacialis]